MKNITIIGTGAYGTCLAQVLSDNNHHIIMYGIDNDEISNINKQHNKKYFSNVKLNQTIRATNNINLALEKCEIIVIAVPTQYVKTVCENINKFLLHPVHIVNIAKGLDINTGKILSNTIAETISKNKILSNCFLSGPSFATEIIMKNLTSITISSSKIEAAQYMKKVFENNYFIVNINTDIIGSQYGAALKNAIAIMAGIFSGRKASDSTIASIIAKGWNEVVTFALNNQSQITTFLSISILGDLILTTSSKKSRNFQLGYAIGVNDNVDTNLEKTKTTVEGYIVTKIIYHQIKNQKLNLPFFEVLYQILYNNKKPSNIINKIWINGG